QRAFVEAGIARQPVLRAHDGGVAPALPEADRTLLDPGDIGDAVDTGVVMRDRTPLAAAADDDHVVMGLRLRLAPGGFPALVAAQPLPEEAQSGIAVRDRLRPRRHGRPPSQGAPSPVLRASLAPGCRNATGGSSKGRRNRNA